MSLALLFQLKAQNQASPAIRAVQGDIARLRTSVSTDLRGMQSASTQSVSAITSSMSQMSAATAQTSKSMAALSGAMGGLAVLAGQYIAREIQQGISAWLNYSAQLEATTIAFTTMLGSVEAATSHLNELKQFALTTPFEFGELVAASQRMQALGIAAENVVPLLNDIGNAVAAAGGGGERLDRVVLAIAQIESKGKVATQELNQLAESGISGFKILEEATGKTRNELVKLVEAGKISSAEFIKAFQTFSEQNFGGLMEAQSKTFLGAMSNIKDALLQTSQTAFEPLYERLSELANRMADTSTKSKEFRDDMAAVGRELARVWDGAVKAIHLVHDLYQLVLAAIIGQIGLTIHAFQALIRAIHAVVLAFKALAQGAMGDYVGALVTIGQSNQQARLSVLELRDAVIAAGSAWNEMGNIMERNAARGVAAAVKVAFAAAVIMAQEASSGANLLGAGVGIGAGITRAKPISIGGSGSGSGTAKKTDNTLRDATRDAALAEREALLITAADVAENQRALDEQTRSIEEFTARAIELNQLQLDAAIDRITKESDALDAALKKKSITQDEYDTKQRELDLDAAKAHQENKDEQFELERDRDREISEARIAAIKRADEIADDADARAIRRIEERIDAEEIAESEGMLQIAAIEAEGLARRIKALREEEEAYSTSLERRKDINAEIIRLDARRTESAEEASRRIAQARFDEDNAGAEGATRNRRAGIDRPEITDSIDQLFEAIDKDLTGDTQTAALAGLGALETAFQGVANAVGAAVEAWVLYGKAGASVRQVTAQILASIAQQAAVKAIFELAQGFGALALAFFGLPNAGPSAAAHFKAAALYGVVAGVAAVAGRAVAGDSFNKGGGGGGSGGGRGGSDAPDKVGPIDLNRTQRNEQIHIFLHGEPGPGFADAVINTTVKDVQRNGTMRNLIIETAGSG